MVHIKNKREVKFADRRNIYYFFIYLFIYYVKLCSFYSLILVNKITSYNTFAGMNSIDNKTRFHCKTFAHHWFAYLTYSFDDSIVIDKIFILYASMHFCNKNLALSAWPISQMVLDAYNIWNNPPLIFESGDNERCTMCISQFEQCRFISIL